MSTKQLPRSVRNNNPGNLDHNPKNKWLGILPFEKRSPEQKAEKRFEIFESPVYGFRAIAILLQTYQDKHKLDTVRKIINRWAPPVENQTDAYVNAVARAVKVRADDLIDVHQYDYMRPLVEAIAVHETGAGYKWPSNQIEEGLRRAGITKDAAKVAKVPVTKETVGATATGGLGAIQIADAMPQVIDAMTNAEVHISSGSWVRIGFGIMTIAVAIFIAYSQVKKHQAGLE